MPIKPDAVGAESEPFELSWDSKACLLYALGVGAGSEELAFTTESSQGVEQQAVPTMGLILGGGAESVLQQLGTFDWRSLLHGAQSLELHQPLPVAGQLRGITRIAAIHDKGSAAVVKTQITDALTGKALFTSRSSLTSSPVSPTPTKNPTTPNWSSTPPTTPRRGGQPDHPLPRTPKLHRP